MTSKASPKQKKNKARIAFIDDEPRVLRTLKMQFKREFEVFTTTSPEEFFQIIRDNDIQVAVSDQRMPLMDGVDVLTKVKELSPNTVRVLLTGYADINAIVASLNKGEIFRYLTKPWQADELLKTMHHAVAYAKQLAYGDALPNLPSFVNTMSANTNSTNTSSTNISTVSTATENNTQDNSQLAPIHITQAIAIQKRNADIVSHDAKVLLLTDDAFIESQLQNQFLNQFSFATYNNLTDAKRAIAARHFHVIIADLSLAGDVFGFLDTANDISPSSPVIALTNEQDSLQLINMINTGRVFRCLHKPISPAILQAQLSQAMKQHHRLANMPMLKFA